MYTEDEFKHACAESRAAGYKEGRLDLIEKERRAVVPDVPQTLEDDYALSRRVCHGQAQEIDTLTAKLSAAYAEIERLKKGK